MNILIKSDIGFFKLVIHDAPLATEANCNFFCQDIPELLKKLIPNCLLKMLREEI